MPLHTVTLKNNLHTGAPCLQTETEHREGHDSLPPSPWAQDLHAAIPTHSAVRAGAEGAGGKDARSARSGGGGQRGCLQASPGSLRGGKGSPASNTRWKKTPPTAPHSTAAQPQRAAQLPPAPPPPVTSPGGTTSAFTRGRRALPPTSPTRAQGWGRAQAPVPQGGAGQEAGPDAQAQ